VSQRPEHALEPTLAELLTHFARTTVPRRLYQLLQLGIPFAIDFGRVARATAGVLAAGISATLLIELFLRILGNAPIS